MPNGRRSERSTTGRPVFGSNRFEDFTINYSQEVDGGEPTGKYERIRATQDEGPWKIEDKLLGENIELVQGMARLDTTDEHTQFIMFYLLTRMVNRLAGCRLTFSIDGGMIIIFS